MGVEELRTKFDRKDGHMFTMWLPFLLKPVLFYPGDMCCSCFLPWTACWATESLHRR